MPLLYFYRAARALRAKRGGTSGNHSGPPHKRSRKKGVQAHLSSPVPSEASPVPSEASVPSGGLRGLEKGRAGPSVITGASGALRGLLTSRPPLSAHAEGHFEARAKTKNVKRMHQETKSAICRNALPVCSLPQSSSQAAGNAQIVDVDGQPVRRIAIEDTSHHCLESLRPITWPEG